MDLLEKNPDRLTPVGLLLGLLLAVPLVSPLGAATNPAPDRGKPAPDRGKPAPDQELDQELSSEPEPHRPKRGMTVSCPTWGPIWGSPSMAKTLAELKTLGVDWVSIHPYAGVRRDGTVRVRPAAQLDFLAKAVELAEQADIELFWKPHLAYWGSFEWRGSIAFGDDRAAWRRFFDGYREFIVDQATFAQAHDIPLFAVGLEYENTTHHEAEWRRIIAAVRQVYKGRLTYSANWDRLHDVPFWDALDVISVQGYFPLAQAPDTHPDAEAIEKRWDGPIRELRALHERFSKPVLFAEIGYDLSPKAATEPWLNASRDNEANRSLRRRLMDVAVQRLEQEPFIEGMFWWKWIPDASPSRDFAMQHPDAKDALRRAWASSGGAHSQN